MPWDPFLVKKLLKSEVCGSREQYTGSTGVAEKSNIMAKKKKKRKERNANVGRANARSKCCLNAKK